MAAHGHTVKSRIGNGHRLYRDRMPIDFNLGNREQRTLEPQDPVALAAGAFGKQDQTVASHQAIADFIGMAFRVSGPTVNENRALQTGQDSKYRPGT